MASATTTPNPDLMSGEDLSALVHAHQQLKAANDPRADKIGGFIQSQVKAGNFEPLDANNPNHTGILSYLGDPSVWKSAASGVLSDVARIPSSVSPYPLMDTEAKQQIATQSQQQAASEKAAGYSKPYRAIAPVATAIGVNVPGMEQAAKSGDVGGVIGHAVALPATVATLGGAGAALSKLHQMVPSLPRAGQGIGIIRDAIGDAPTQGQDGIGFQKANTEMNTLTSTGQPVPGPLKAFVEGVQAGKPLDIHAMLDSVATTDPELAAKARVALDTQEAMDKAQPPRPDAGVVDPNTFAGLTKFRTIFNSWKFERSLPQTTRDALGHSADAMGQEAQQIADQNGFGKEWNKYQKEYASGQQAIRTAAKVGPVVGKVAGGVLGAAVPEMIPGVPQNVKGLATIPGIKYGMDIGNTVGGAAEPITRAIVNRPGVPKMPPMHCHLLPNPTSARSLPKPWKTRRKARSRLARWNGASPALAAATRPVPCLLHLRVNIQLTSDESCANLPLEVRICNQYLIRCAQ